MRRYVAVVAAVLATITGVAVLNNDDGLPPLGQPSCVEGAVNVTTAAAVDSNVQAGNDVCITADVGDVTLSSGSAYTSANVEHIGTTGAGRIDILFMDGVIGMNLRIRAHDVGLYDSENITLEQSRLGGESYNDREGFEAIDLRDKLNGCDNCIVRDNDIGFMTQDEDTGNSGFCIRMTGDNDNLQVVRNKIHDCVADGINGIDGDNVLIDRNEIGPVGDDPSCTFGANCEHSDGIQITGRTGSITISNNWIHHEGYFTNSSGNLISSAAASGTTYIHGGGTNSILYENNLVENSRGRVEICGLGTPDPPETYANSNITVRGNTFYDLGKAWVDPSIEGFRWVCQTGSGNTIENNVMADSDASSGFYDTGLARTITNNANGNTSDFTFDSNRNCTSSNCTTGTPKGFRKPDGVHW